MAKRATKKAAPKKSAAKRELIAPRGDKRYIRRDAAGRIKESDDVSRSLSQDRTASRPRPACSCPRLPRSKPIRPISLAR